MIGANPNAQKKTVLNSNSNNNNNSSGTKNKNAKNGTVVEWETQDNLVAVVFYNEVLLQHKKDMSHVKRFLKSVLKEYELFQTSIVMDEEKKDDESYFASTEQSRFLSLQREETSKLFDKTCEILLKRAETLAKRQSKQMSQENNNSVDDDGSIDVKAGIERLKARSRNSSRQNLQQSSDSTSKKGKEKTVWHDGKGKISKAALAQLDRSSDKVSNDNRNLDPIEAAMADDSNALKEARAAYLPSSEETPAWLQEEETFEFEEDNDSGKNNNIGQTKKSPGFSFQGVFQQISGNKILSEEDLDIPLKEMERMLVSKNVAQEVATEIIDGVRSSLKGKRMPSFSRVKTTVRAALEHSIAKLLSPHRDINILRDAISKRESTSGSSLFSSSNSSGKGSQPYVIVMVGINGVGKSTSLAKLAYYLKTNDCSPLVAACDTFRSGAVEQLGVHAKCLDVPLFHKGYAKDPSSVAKEAITFAKQNKNDVVLIDTAGRMQNNAPLMKALRNLIYENSPDLVIFVGEALVGNDGLDQLQMFDRGLMTGNGNGGVDGIILSKFDTVNEKVGAALGMTKLSGKPVLFTGVGQKYHHLKKLSVNSVIKCLFQ